MTPRVRPWQIGASVVVALALLLWLVHSIYALSLRPVRFGSGWMLLLVIASLALFNARKKLPFLPLGSASAWTEFHVYAGWFSIVLFVFHAGFRVPNGPLEVLLALLFATVAASGVVGLALSRLLPPRLTTAGEAILFERIPALRLRLRREVEELAVRSVQETQNTTISDFCAQRLLDFFHAPRNFVPHLLDSERPRRDLLGELWALERYASPKGREILEQISDCVRMKDTLDRQYTLQAVLRYWLFVHIPMTYGLLIFTGIHVLLVYGFHGGIR